MQDETTSPLKSEENLPLTTNDSIQQRDCTHLTDCGCWAFWIFLSMVLSSEGPPKVLWIIFIMILHTRKRKGKKSVIILKCVSYESQFYRIEMQLFKMDYGPVLLWVRYLFFHLINTWMQLYRNIWLYVKLQVILESQHHPQESRGKQCYHSDGWQKTMFSQNKKAYQHFRVTNEISTESNRIRFPGNMQAPIAINPHTRIKHVSSHQNQTAQSISFRNKL